MPDAPESQSVIRAAEEAAAAGDYISAEQLLRSGALLQEAELGPLDPGLANTLNNLGVVCEMIGKPDDAESFYRRAYEIARAVLAHDHPFVTTSRQNLSDFHQLRGGTLKSSATPAPEPQADSVPLQLPAFAVALPPIRRSATASPRRPADRWSRPVLIGALSVCGFGVVLATAMVPWSRSAQRSGPSPIVATQSLAQDPLPPPPTRGVAEPAEPIAPAKEIALTLPPPTATEKKASVPSAAIVPVVTSAQLCGVLTTGEEWKCTPPKNPIVGGSLVFYTRLRSAKDTTVEHRWYQGDHLYQFVALRIQANQGPGYRTYSLHTLNAESAGRWRVELRSSDGALLHQERFVVQ